MSTFYTAQLDPYALSGAGAVAGATSITLKSFQTIDGVDLAMADFGAKGYGTLEPGNGTLEEQISFTGVVQNSNGTATLTGVKSVLFLYPYTETSGLSKTHAGSTSFVISNTSGFYNNLTAKANNETITGYWDVPDPVGMANIANKEYVLSVVNGGTVTTNALIEVGTAGETLAAGDPVYLKAADGRWWKATASTAATVDVIQLGIAQGAGTAGNTITGGVLRKGIDTHQSGGAAGSLGYISNSSTISTTPGTVSRAVGNFITATTFDFDPYFYYVPTSDQKAAMQGGGSLGTPSSSNKFETETGVAAYVAAFSAPVVRVYTAWATWTKPAGLKYVSLRVQAAGGGARGANSGTGQSRPGGGGGAYGEKEVLAASLGATETVTVGSGGTGGDASTDGGTGGTSSFGSHVSCTGGTGGSTATPGAGGTSTGGDLNITGQSGMPSPDTSQIRSGAGGNSILGFGGAGTQAAGVGKVGVGYGGGGSGAADATTSNNAGGAGAPGVIIVTEYYI